MPAPHVNHPPSTETVGLLIEHGVRVRVTCTVCRTNWREVDLEKVARVKGRDFSLWNKRTRCRLTPGCEGLNEFMHDSRGYFVMMRD